MQNRAAITDTSADIQRVKLMGRKKHVKTGFHLRSFVFFPPLTPWETKAGYFRIVADAVARCGLRWRSRNKWYLTLNDVFTLFVFVFVYMYPIKQATRVVSTTSSDASVFFSFYFPRSPRFIRVMFTIRWRR